MLMCTWLCMHLSSVQHMHCAAHVITTQSKAAVLHLPVHSAVFYGNAKHLSYDRSYRYSGISPGK